MIHDRDVASDCLRATVWWIAIRLKTSTWYRATSDIRSCGYTAVDPGAKVRTNCKAHFALKAGSRLCKGSRGRSTYAPFMRIPLRVRDVAPRPQATDTSAKGTLSWSNYRYSAPMCGSVDLGRVSSEPHVGGLGVSLEPLKFGGGALSQLPKP
jgi:hypothetical protein